MPWVSKQAESPAACKAARAHTNQAPYGHVENAALS
jgi:hypothetical protein